MIFKNLLNFVDNLFIFINKNIHSLYLNSSIYDKKISPSGSSFLKYKPNPSLLDCLIKYNKKKKILKIISLMKYGIIRN